MQHHELTVYLLGKKDDIAIVDVRGRDGTEPVPFLEILGGGETGARDVGANGEGRLPVASLGCAP